MTTKARAWTFTINNPDKVDLDKVKENLLDCRYWIMGNEVGESGTPHIQGYLYVSNAVSFNTVRMWLLGAAHVEKAKGNPKQNFDYCSKDGSFEEHGTLPASPQEKGEKGKESQQEKWKQIWDLAKAGDIEKLAEEFPKEAFVHVRNVLLIRQLGVEGCKDLDDVCGIWYYGKSGVGKSHRARAHDPEAYIKGINKWWCNYTGQKTVILEDVSNQHTFLGDFLKIWADKWAFTAEFKGGGMARMRPQTLIVTSQYRIADIWPDEETRTALERRFKEIEVFRGPIDEAFSQCAQVVEMSPVPEPDDSPPRKRRRMVESE